MLITSSGTGLAPQFVFLSDSWVGRKAKQLVWVAAGEVAARDGTETTATPGVCASCLLEISFDGCSALWGY